MKAIFLSINLDGVASIVVVKSVYHSVLGLIGCFRAFLEIILKQVYLNSTRSTGAIRVPGLEIQRQFIITGELAELKTSSSRFCHNQEV